MKKTDTFKTNLPDDKLAYIDRQVDAYASKRRLTFTSLDEVTQRGDARVDIYMSYRYPRATFLTWDHLLLIKGELISEEEYKRRRSAGCYSY